MDEAESILNAMSELEALLIASQLRVEYLTEQVRAAKKKELIEPECSQDDCKVLQRSIDIFLNHTGNAEFLSNIPERPKSLSSECVLNHITDNLLPQSIQTKETPARTCTTLFYADVKKYIHAAQANVLVRLSMFLNAATLYETQPSIKAILYDLARGFNRYPTTGVNPVWEEE